MHFPPVLPIRWQYRMQSLGSQAILLLASISEKEKQPVRKRKSFLEVKYGLCSGVLAVLGRDLQKRSSSRANAVLAATEACQPAAGYAGCQTLSRVAACRANNNHNRVA